MFIKAYATGGSGKRGTATPGMRKGNGFRSMSAYYRAGGQSALGATAKTQGKPATIKQVKTR